MKHTDVISSIYIYIYIYIYIFLYKFGDHVRISSFKNISAKGYISNWSEVFLIKRVKRTVPWTYVISDLNGEEIVGMFYKKELQKTNQKEFSQL